MKNWWIGSVLVCLLCLPVFAQMSMGDYQAGKVVKVEKLEGSAPSGGTDAPSKPDVYNYNVSIQVGDTVYVTRYHEATGELGSWLPGRDVQVRIKGKVMYVKRATGKDAKGSILRTSKADQT